MRKLQKMRLHFLVILLIVIIINSCTTFICDNSSIPVSELSNFDKTKKAIFFQKFSGLSVDGYQVSILTQKQKFNGCEVGNTYTAIDSTSRQGFDNTAIKLEWLSNDTLVIHSDKKLATCIITNSIQNVTVVYKNF